MTLALGIIHAADIPQLTVGYDTSTPHQTLSISFFLEIASEFQRRIAERHVAESR